MRGSLRNVGGRPTQAVDYPGRDCGLALHTAKDDAMLRDADYGLFAWDGKSKGTLRNIRIMAEQGKPSSVYVSPAKKFVTVRGVADASNLLRHMDGETAHSEDILYFSTERKRAGVGGRSVGSIETAVPKNSGEDV